MWLGWGWGIWPGATAPQPAHCLPCGRKRLLPRAGGASGTLTQLRLRVCADATGPPPPPDNAQGPGSWGWGRATQLGPLQGHPTPTVRRLDTSGRPRLQHSLPGGAPLPILPPPNSSHNCQVTQLGGDQPIAGRTADGHLPAKAEAGKPETRKAKT